MEGMDEEGWAQHDLLALPVFFQHLVLLRYRAPWIHWTGYAAHVAAQTTWAAKYTLDE
jgi:hypothetical protein